ncbi:cell division protein ZapE [Pseudomonas sp. NC26]|uniref:Cell division protein ZapE n=1 Tax=Pseudomonas putida TaxID=303 RepID=A0A7W2QHM4_PSEPU|nr:MULTISPECIES: cell division protein ZapE [Pseudomonas]MBA6114897.1 cell division protein ZapE [Pseudomonas putida]MCZ9637004.1 cell division protein ZapE [Pseudomonas putida]MEC4875080.1 cell division protein ZapE [Pseudomonas sp. NC26]QNL88760.1 ATPase [Pseudomonas putida]
MPAWIPTSLLQLGQRKRAASPSDSPLLGWFEDTARSRGYQLSAGQRRVIQCMAEPLAQLQGGQPRSLYLYGAVGRGKSWLLDGFFQAVPVQAKQRLHFHDFFARLHQGMHRHRSLDDALGATLDELLGNCRVLCFDEFHVHDIGDAMLLTRLFNALFARGIFLLVTSNYAPEGLLPNPLYHERFLPVIRLINGRMDVLEVGGDTDFRSLPANREHQRFTQGHYVWPGNAAQRQALKVPAVQPLTLDVNKRNLRALHSADRQVMFAFDDLCEQPTAVIDYLQLARQYDAWVIDGLDDLSQCSLAAQQRFINLVDVLYDQDRHVTVIGRRPLEQSLDGAIADLMRTRSRLGQLHQVGPE